MLSISVTEFNKHLPLYLDKAMRGETIIVRRNRKEIARLVPPAAAPRRPGLVKGRLTESFFEPLPEDELKAWEA
jgi:prevent-host-death family protein